MRIRAFFIFLLTLSTSRLLWAEAQSSREFELSWEGFRYLEQSASLSWADCALWAAFKLDRGELDDYSISARFGPIGIGILTPKGLFASIWASPTLAPFASPLDYSSARAGSSDSSLVGLAIGGPGIGPQICLAKRGPTFAALAALCLEPCAGLRIDIGAFFGLRQKAREAEEWYVDPIPPSSHAIGAIALSYDSPAFLLNASLSLSATERGTMDFASEAALAFRLASGIRLDLGFFRSGEGFVSASGTRASREWGLGAKGSWDGAGNSTRSIALYYAVEAADPRPSPLKGGILRAELKFREDTRLLDISFKASAELRENCRAEWQWKARLERSIKLQTGKLILCWDGTSAISNESSFSDKEGLSLAYEDKSLRVKLDAGLVFDTGFSWLLGLTIRLAVLNGALSLSLNTDEPIPFAGEASPASSGPLDGFTLKLSYSIRVNE